MNGSPFCFCIALISEEENYLKLHNVKMPHKSSEIHKILRSLDHHVSFCKDDMKKKTAAEQFVPAFLLIHDKTFLA